MVERKYSIHISNIIKKIKFVSILSGTGTWDQILEDPECPAEKPEIYLRVNGGLQRFKGLHFLVSCQNG